MKKTKTYEYGGKTKSTALILAVLFGFWTWLYTYREDGWKFWLNLILSVITFGLWGLIAWFWAVIEVATKDKGWYEQYNK